MSERETFMREISWSRLTNGTSTYEPGSNRIHSYHSPLHTDSTASLAVNGPLSAMHNGDKLYTVDDNSDAVNEYSEYRPSRTFARCMQSTRQEAQAKAAWDIAAGLHGVPRKTLHMLASGRSGRDSTSLPLSRIIPSTALGGRAEQCAEQSTFLGIPSYRPIAIMIQSQRAPRRFDVVKAIQLYNGLVTEERQNVGETDWHNLGNRLQGVVGNVT